MAGEQTALDSHSACTLPIGFDDHLIDLNSINLLKAIVIIEKTNARMLLTLGNSHSTANGVGLGR